MRLLWRDCAVGLIRKTIFEYSLSKSSIKFHLCISGDGKIRGVCQRCPHITQLPWFWRAEFAFDPLWLTSRKQESEHLTDVLKKRRLATSWDQLWIKSSIVWNKNWWMEELQHCHSSVSLKVETDDRFSFCSVLSALPHPSCIDAIKQN